MSRQSKDLQLSLSRGTRRPEFVLATAQMIEVAALVETLLREIATALANWEASDEQDHD